MSSAVRNGIAIILARAGTGDVQAAFSLAATAAAMGDPAGIFVTQDALRWLSPILEAEHSDIADLRMACIEAGVRLFACSASMTQFNLDTSALVESAEVVGAPTFYRFALGVGVSLYI